ncbi:MAG: hypothetical protein R2741_05345 [Methanolobus sp.]
MNVVGIESGKISSIVSFGALNGMLFGPFWGAIVSATGFLLYEVTSGNFASMSTFSRISPLFIALSSIVAGLIVNREYKAAKAIFLALIAGWYLLDVGRAAYAYPWYHFLVLGVFIIFEKSILSRQSSSRVYIFTSLFLASLMAVLADHMAGSITYYLLYDLHPQIYNSVIFVYPVERTLLAFFPAFLVYVLIVVFKDILLSSDDIEIALKDMKNKDLEEYLQNDVLKIIKEDDEE